MNMDEILTKELDTFCAKTGKRDLDILEIGTIRHEGDQYHDGDGWSTLTFARHVSDHGGSLTSVDLAIDASRNTLEKHGLLKHVALIQGYSIDVMGSFLTQRLNFDVIFLDSDNDPVLVMDEYFLAKQLLAEPGLIMADDMDQGSRDALKGERLIPYLREQGTGFRVEQRQTTRFTRDMLVIQP